MTNLFAKSASYSKPSRSKAQTKKEKKAFKKDSSGPSVGNKILTWLQELGKALQFPVAVLPFAAILSRFGALGVQYTSHIVDGVTVIDPGVGNAIGYWISFIIRTPGQIVFDNLPLIFAIGVAFGFAKDHRGEVALVGAIFYLAIAAMNAEHALPEMLYKNVMTFTVGTGDQAKHYSQLFYVKTYTDGVLSGAQYVLDVGVLGGITAGVLSALLYNKYKEIKLPTALSFFGGRRFVPMLALASAIPTALFFAILWPWIQYVLMLFGNAIAGNQAVAIPGASVYVALNRLLLPFGLHQILNTFFWFQLPLRGEVIASGSGNVINPGVQEIVSGDIPAFAAGIEGAGIFQSGFFPIMMGGIPAIALAMIFAAPKANRKEVGGFLGGVAIVSLISGITEPIEYSFVFLSPLLLGIHALLSGLFTAVVTAMHIRVGFGFSAGVLDYGISFAQSWGYANHETGVYHILANPLWILLLTVIAAGVYFPIFYFTILGMDIQTPGREKDYGGPVKSIIEDDKEEAETKSDEKLQDKVEGDKYEVMARKIIKAIGVDNFKSVDNCATRLRLILVDNSKVDDAAIKAAGAFGVKRLGTEAFQIVIGTDVEHVANQVKKQLKAAGSKIDLN